MKIIFKGKPDDDKIKNIFLIRLKNEEEFLISDEDYFSNGVYELDFIDEKKLRELSINLLVKKAKAIAIKFVILKIRSTGEVKTKLASLGYSEDIIHSTIEYLLESNYVNDENYARAYSNHLFKTKRLSTNQVKYELKRKGVDTEIIDSVLGDQELSDLEVAKSAFQKKYRNFDNSDKKQKAKAQNFLMSKGFSYDIIKQVFEDEV
ncbi:MAG: regulatory protein RecX [Bacillota bacterium]